MVKIGPCTKTTYGFKNRHHSDFHMRIEKVGKSTAVVLEQKLNSSFWNNNEYLVVIVLMILALIYSFCDKIVTVYAAIVVIVTFLYYYLSTVREESVVAVKSLGYQITIKYAIGQKSLFIPCNKVQSIFISEVILQNQVIHLLTITTKEKDNLKIIPVFLNIKPRLQCLQLICKQLKDVSR